MQINKPISLVGYASGMAASDPGTATGPSVLQASPFMREWSAHWQAMLQPNASIPSVALQVADLCLRLGRMTEAFVKKKQFFTVLGGDHSCAIGTWSGVAQVLSSVGLIWIDAHMDSHTPDTTETGNIHGMPLACLLGYGDPEFTEMMGRAPKLKPENICLIGTRSYEQGEAALLNNLGVRIYAMDEIKQRGLNSVMQDAIELVSKNTVGFGVSLDLDGIDPVDAPGTGMHEPDGLSATDLLQALTLLRKLPQMIGAEIVEFDPTKDREQMTEQLIPKLIQAMR